MKYETLKTKMAAAVGDRVHREASYIAKDASLTVSMDMIAERRTHAASREALVKEVEQRILNWDVRLVGQLRELFPKEFPTSLRKGQLLAEYDEAGDWAVVLA